MMNHLREGLAEMFRQASTNLPKDVEAALAEAARTDKADGARAVLETIVENVVAAREAGSPICQDTGYPSLWIRFPEGFTMRGLRAAVEAALSQVTAEGILRPNAVDPVTGVNSGDNIGVGVPAIYFEETDGSSLEIDLMLKGGGSENVSAQARLPNAALGAGRDLDGVRKVVLDALHQAQGFGCAPGIIGIGIGGDRAGSLALAKRQLLRPLGEPATDPELAQLEVVLRRQINELGIGTMGFGGDVTVLGVKAGRAHRHPASFFVSIAYGCWALRRKHLSFNPGAPERWTVA